MRRSALVLVVAVSALLVLGSSASALCTTQPFDQAIHQAGYSPTLEEIATLDLAPG